MYRHIREKNVYENSFQSISDRFFKDSPWPSVASYVDNDHVFCLLYREMWFRHLYARLSPMLKQRVDSWDNYCSLFQRGSACKDSQHNPRRKALRRAVFGLLIDTFIEDTLEDSANSKEIKGAREIRNNEVKGRSSIIPKYLQHIAFISEMNPIASEI